MTKPDASTPRPAIEPAPVDTQPLGSRIDPNRVHSASEGQPVAEPSGLSEFDLAALPTGVRQQLLVGELPVVPAHQLFDTSPPNKRMAAPRSNGTPSVPPLPRLTETDERRLPVRSKRNTILGFLVAAVVLAAIAMALARSGNPNKETAAAASSRALGSRATAQALRVGPAIEFDGAHKVKPAASAEPLSNAAPTEPGSAQPAPTLVSKPSTVVKPTPARNPHAPASSTPQEPKGSILDTIVAPENE